MFHQDEQIRGGPSRSWMASWSRLLAALGLGLGLAACGLTEPQEDSAATASSALSNSGHVTGLCGYTPPLPPGFTGPSPAGPCEGVCRSDWSNGSCRDPADAASHIQVYGCPGKTGGQACDGYTHNGVMIADLYNVGTVSISDFWHMTQYCTFQLDVLRPNGGDPIGLRDFIIWERDECGSPPPVNNPPVCVARGAEVCAPAGQCVAHVSINGGSYDPDGDPLAVTQTPPGPYGLGTTHVRLSVSDGALTGTCGADVTVNDCEPPVITCPAAAVAECMGDGMATVDPGDAIATDLCSPVTVTDPGPGDYPLGTTPVEYTATDSYGNSASCTGSVTVVDTTPPVIIPEEPLTLWPPNHEYHRISLADCAKAYDQCYGELPVEAGEILCVTSDEPDDAAGGGDGHTTGDIVIIDGQFVDLRAERAGSGNGRVYRITFQFTDPAGNTATEICEVGVPHSGNGDPAEADEPVEQVCRTPEAAQAAALKAQQLVACGKR
jgi:hypothetical protein